MVSGDVRQSCEMDVRLLGDCNNKETNDDLRLIIESCRNFNVVVRGKKSHIGSNKPSVRDCSGKFESWSLNTENEINDEFMS